MTGSEILEAIRALPRADRLRLAEELNRDLVEMPASETEQQGPHMAQRGRLLVYTGPLPDRLLDHRVNREEHINYLISQIDARHV